MPVAVVGIAIMRINPAVRIVFDPDVVVCHGKNMIVSETFNHKPPMVHPVAVHNPAVVKKENNAIMRDKEWAQAVVPEMIIGNKREVFGPKTEIHVERQASVEI